jgi:hypothetical protein
MNSFRARVGANTPELSLVFPRFSLADAVVDPIEEGGRRGNELGPDRPQPPLRTDVQILRSGQSAVDKAWTLPNAARKWRRHKISEGYL